MMKIHPAVAVGALLISLFLAPASHAGSAARDAAAKIIGKYRGGWKMYGLVDGKVGETASWSDVITAGNLTEEKNRAYVEVINVMTFSDGTTRTSKFIEGYFLNADGTLGDRFYEIQGRVIVFKRVTNDNWVYQATPDQGELRMLGFDPKTVVTASHVAIKTTTYQGEIDTDHVTRVTTVQWKAEDESLKSFQFDSMKGHHTRMSDK